MAGTLGSRKVFSIFMIIAYVSALYIVYYYSRESIIYGTIALLVTLLYIYAFTTRPYVRAADKVAAIALYVLVILAGYFTALLFQPYNPLPASLHVLSSTIVFGCIILALVFYSSKK